MITTNALPATSRKGRLITLGLGILYVIDVRTNRLVKGDPWRAGDKGSGIRCRTSQGLYVRLGRKQDRRRRSPLHERSQAIANRREAKRERVRCSIPKGLRFRY
jgi:hypothetical protein